MKLSEAIGLGRMLIKLDSKLFLNGNCTAGCALGMGLVAIHSVDELLALRENTPSWDLISNQWPWLKEENFPSVNTHRAVIGEWARQVDRGEMTLDRLIERVASIEPKEEAEAMAAEESTSSVLEPAKH